MTLPSIVTPSVGLHTFAVTFLLLLTVAALSALIWRFAQSKRLRLHDLSLNATKLPNRRHVLTLEIFADTALVSRFIVIRLWSGRRGKHCRFFYLHSDLPEVGGRERLDSIMINLPYRRGRLACLSIEVLATIL